MKTPNMDKGTKQLNLSLLVGMQNGRVILEKSLAFLIKFSVHSDFPVVQTVKNLPVRHETRVQFPGWEVPLEKGMANGNSSILAWRIPWTEKPGRLQSVGSQNGRVILEKSLAFLIKFSEHLPYNLVVPLMGIFSEK